MSSFIFVLSTLYAVTRSQEITVSGYIVDLWCWDDNNKKALDTQASMLTDPGNHKTYCMWDVSFCKVSGFAFVHQPSGTGNYALHYLLDAEGNAAATTAMKAFGRNNKYFIFNYTGIPDTATTDDCSPPSSVDWYCDGRPILRTPTPTVSPTTAIPTGSPATAIPTVSPTTVSPTTASPTTVSPTTASPTTAIPTEPTGSPITQSPTEATQPPTGSPLGADCLADDIIYSDGDSIGVLGYTCNSSGDETDTTYIGKESVCDDGEIVSIDYDGDCGSVGDGYLCCQTGDVGTMGGAVCVTECDDVVPDSNSEGNVYIITGCVMMVLSVILSM